jgi:hypothetical protein
MKELSSQLERFARHPASLADAAGLVDCQNGRRETNMCHSQLPAALKVCGT